MNESKRARRTCLIVGAGIAGLSVAHALAKEKVSVAVVDDAYCGYSGSTRIRATPSARSARTTLADSQLRSLRTVLRDVMAERHQADCGPWWSAISGDEVDSLALAGGAAIAAGSAQWTTNADGDRERKRISVVLDHSPYATPDEVVVLARDGQGVLRPADLYT